MKLFDALLLLAVGFCGGGAFDRYVMGGFELAPQPAPEHRIRYANEEATAAKACGRYRLLYWWLEDLRKTGAVMHVRCAGQVTVVTEVKFDGPK